ncbi:MAG: amidohydrolase family protein [Proteobacteria bacterium]|nr:amidohydrolase family protein [Pseudomonadota bacterium]
MLIIDFHFHITKFDDYNEWFSKWASDMHGPDTIVNLRKILASPESILHFLDQQGVDLAVALAEYNPMVTGVCSNERVGAFCKGSERLIPFASINPFVTFNAVEELNRCVTDFGCRGIKLYPTYQHFYPNDNRLFPVYGRAQELGIPIMFHTGSSVFPNALLKYGDPLALDEVAVFFPRLIIIQSHSGRGFWYDRAFFLSVLHENVYMDITGLPPKNLLKYFPDLEKNQDRILFGSDWPGIKSIQDNVTAIQNLPIGEDAKAKILGLNAARILNINR